MSWLLTVEWVERHHEREYAFAHRLAFPDEVTACRERVRIISEQRCPSPKGYAVDCHGPVQT